MDKFSLETVNPCCCVSLRTGAFIIAVLEIVSSIILVCIAAFFPHELELLDLTNYDYSEVSENGHVRDSLYNWVLVLLLVQITFASVLLHGIRKENPLFLKLWMVCQLVWIGLDILVKILLACLRIKREKGYVAEFEDIFEYLLYAYFLFIVYRLHSEMRENAPPQKEPEPDIENM